MISFGAVGDIMLSRGVGDIIKTHDPLYPFKHITQELTQYDILFGNLESPLSTRGSPCKGKDPHITFRADPIAVQGLKATGFNILSLANNHILDYGKDALTDTNRCLDEHGIKYIGVNKKKSQSPVIIEKLGLRIAFLSYTSYPIPKLNRHKRHNTYVGQLKIEYVRSDINRLKQYYKPDVTIISVHWCIDYARYPIPFQMEYAREMIDLGADLIIGHHPHVIQGIEEYKEGLIIYSLGNFIFDEPFQETKKSFIFSCKLSKSGVQGAEIIPVISNKTHQPALAKGDESLRIKQEIEELSEEYKKNRWMKDDSKNPESTFFMVSLKLGLKDGNLLNYLGLFPKSFLLTKALRIIFMRIINKFRCN